jgi:uncharacterized RDD family membrane protein YckC
MDKTTVVLLRIPAFIIDFVIIMGAIGLFNKAGIYYGMFENKFEVELLLFVCIPLGFFFYWLGNVNLGKRLFRLKVVSAASGDSPTVFQYFRRCLLMSLVVSLNILFLIPMLVSKRNQGLHDMMANTVVVRVDRKQI